MPGDQLDIDFNVPKVVEPPEAFARRTDPQTAHDAAASIEKDLPELEARVLSWLVERGDRGGTSEEIADGLHMSRVTVSPRLRPLANKHLLADTKERRLGPSGRKSIVWKAVRRV